VGFLLQSQLYYLTEPTVNLLYLAISDSGVNDVSLIAIMSHVPRA